MGRTGKGTFLAELCLTTTMVKGARQSYHPPCRVKVIKLEARKCFPAHPTTSPGLPAQEGLIPRKGIREG